MKGTIKSKEDVERLFSQGRRSTSSSMTILVCENEAGTIGDVLLLLAKSLVPLPSEVVASALCVR